MTGESPEQWLTREVGDLFNAGGVGLYADASANRR